MSQDITVTGPPFKVWRNAVSGHIVAQVNGLTVTVPIDEPATVSDAVYSCLVDAGVELTVEE